MVLDAPVLKGALANIICIFAWTAPLGLLPGAVILMTHSHGLRAVLLGFTLMAGLLGGPPRWQFRLAVYSVLLSIAASSGSVSALIGAAALAGMLLMITVRPGGPEAWRPSPAFSRLVTEVLDGTRYYARCEVIGAVDKLPRGRTLLAAHPHGVLTAGFTWNLFWNFALHQKTGPIGFLLDEGLRLKSPTFRLMCDWFAAPGRWAGAASKDVIKDAMRRGDSLALIPGGFQEATICKRGAERVYIKQRAGFLKYCLQEGYAVVPVYTFGEADTYTTFTKLIGPRLWLAKRNIPAAAMFGHWACPLLPRAGVSLVTCVGRPLQLPKIAEPTKEDVAAAHAQYVAALQATFDEHKAAAGRPDAVLEIW